MMIYTTHMMIVTTFSMLLLMASIILGGRFLSSRNKNTPFECGFDPKDSGRLPFSMRFFLLAVVFLIFDIEVALLFPLVLGMGITAFKSTMVASLGFLIVLLGGLLHEWNQGSLSWVL